MDGAALITFVAATQQQKMPDSTLQISATKHPPCLI
jgi:hypothetical protein